MSGVFFGVFCFINAFIIGNVAFQNPIVAVIPRIMFGFIAGIGFELLKLIKKPKLRFLFDVIFCGVYHTTFPRFKKIDVNGESADPLFKFLKNEMPVPTNEGNKVKNLAIAAAAKLSKAVHEDNDIKWNFTKFLIDREGKVVGRFEPTVTPDVIAPAIKELL